MTNDRPGSVAPSSFPDERSGRALILDLSLILGCHNGARHLEHTVFRLAELLNQLAWSYEVLVVEDGSLDESPRILHELETRIPQLIVLENPKNMGKGFSIRNGVVNCRGRHVVFTDVDMAYAPSNVLTVIEHLAQGCPVVVGNRRLPESVYTASNRLVRYVYRRHRIGLMFNFVVRHLFGLSARDTQSGLKGFTRPVAMKVFRQITTDGFLFDVEIFICCKNLDLAVTEIPVHVTFDDDESTVRQFSTFLRILPDLGRIKRRQLQGGYGKSDTARTPPHSEREPTPRVRPEERGESVPTAHLRTTD